ncbi:MAG: nitroreductase [Rhodospirillales bacterium]
MTLTRALADGPLTAEPGLDPEALAAAVGWALGSRRSIRAFRPDPVPRATLEAILALAARAPSGTNMQPWAVTVLTGKAKAELSVALLEAHAAGGEGHKGEYKYYPDRFEEPYRSRRRKVGWDLYGLLGIGRDDREKMKAQIGRNYRFFDAPVGMIVTIDRSLEIGSWLDLGMFLQSICVAARGYGLDTCPQAAFAAYHRIIREALDLPDEQVVVCGLALGRADYDAVENGLVTERAGLESFVRFLD